MNQKFFDIPKEKQDRIINAALQVFSQNGYRHAGTDEVVRRAGISKGLLFHYFESKLGLYIFLYDYAVRYMLLELAGGTEKNEKDLFALIRLIEEAAFRACRQYPYLKAFLDSAREEDCREAFQAVAEQKRRYEKRLEEILRQADTHLLRPRADLPRIMGIMDYTFRGLTRERCRQENFSPEELFGEIFRNRLDNVFIPPAVVAQFPVPVQHRGIFPAKVVQIRIYSFVRRHGLSVKEIL